MWLRFRRVLRSVLLEAAWVAVGATLAAVLLKDLEDSWAAAVFLISVLAAGAGMLRLWGAGDLALAWRCPRLDRGGLFLRGKDAPWELLRTAEATLAVFEREGTAFRPFFSGAERDLVASSERAVEAYRLARRAQAALTDAPPGEARIRLEHQRDAAGAELEVLKTLLQEVRARFLAATAPSSRVEDALPALRALEQRSGALGDALDELRQSPPRVSSMGGRT